MKLNSDGRNMTVLYLKNGTHVLFSYSTPVAAYFPTTNDGLKGYYRTSKFFSKTTSSHINKWMGSNAVYRLEDQSFFDNLIEEV